MSHVSSANFKKGGIHWDPLGKLTGKRVVSECASSLNSCKNISMILEPHQYKFVNHGGLRTSQCQECFAQESIAKALVDDWSCLEQSQGMFSMECPLSITLHIQGTGFLVCIGKGQHV